MNAVMSRNFHERAQAPAGRRSFRSLYFALLDAFSCTHSSTHSSAHTGALCSLLPDVRKFLQEQLQQAHRLGADFPHAPQHLQQWLHADFTAAGRAYQDYLAERRAGAGPRYLTSRSHALDFLKKSAPTKLVDGSWLYGILQRWAEPDFNHLVRIYLEELGDGVAQQNHVFLYRNLLAANHCDDWTTVDDKYFRQGAIQLALAAMPDEFLPEIIGFNLGYEQLPSHLPITAYELAEYGIDPYYFTLHITIDNFDNGHARHALESVMKLVPAGMDEKQFFQRVRDGYQMNLLGEGAASIADSFDLERELLEVFARKAQVGQYLHCDRCKIQGIGINEWLSRPDGMPDMLRALQASGWIQRHEDPTHSRFWHLIEGKQPLMFGVFDAREKQIVFDWISGDWRPPRAARPRTGALAGRFSASAGDASTQTALPKQCVREHGDMDDWIQAMSPAQHWTDQGLAATRKFAARFYQWLPPRQSAPASPHYHA